MKKLFMYSAVLLLAVGLAAAQGTGGDKAAGTTKPKPKPEVIRKDAHTNQPPDPLVKKTTHHKGHKGGKKTATNDWASTGSGNTGASGKKTGTDNWETTSSGKGKKGHKGSKKGGKKSTDSLQMKPGGPGVPPPTRPTDPK